MRLSQLEPAKIQPRPEELKRVFRMISEQQLPDGTWKQVIITPRGRLIRLMDATKEKVLNQDARNRPVTVAGKEAKAYADIWEGEEPVAKPQPRPEELRKTMQLKMVSEKQMGDKKWYQVWDGPAGKIIKILSPDKKSILHQYSPQRASLNKIKLAQMDLARMSLSEIAQIIRGDWKKVRFSAVPYLQALGTLNSISDNYGDESGASIVAYFLANATTWNGDVARAVKSELNKRLKGDYK